MYDMIDWTLNSKSERKPTLIYFTKGHTTILDNNFK